LRKWIVDIDGVAAIVGRAGRDGQSATGTVGRFHAWELNKNSQLVADLSLDKGMLQDVLSRKL
jgi:hypothetical protein